MNIERFRQIAIFEIENAKSVADDDTEAKLEYYHVIEAIIDMGVVMTGLSPHAITKIIEEIVESCNAITDEHILFFVSEEYLNVETVQAVDKKLNANESAMLCDLHTGEIKAQCDGNHIWQLFF